jgi:hypothetical protein
MQRILIHRVKMRFCQSTISRNGIYQHSSERLSRPGSFFVDRRRGRLGFQYGRSATFYGKRYQSDGSDGPVKVVVAAVQTCSQLTQRAVNVEVADEFLREKHHSGVQLAVLPEMFNTGYGLLPDF